MKIYCKVCDKVGPVIIDNCKDAKTGEPFQDIVCNECHFVIASGTDIDTQRKPLTDRENAIAHFAIHRFMSDAYARMNAAAQDKDNKYFKQGAVEAFAKDAKDAEGLLAKWSAAHVIESGA